MQNLTVGDLSLGLANLETVRKPYVDGCASGQLYGPMLAEKQSAIEGLPEALRGRPLAEELGVTDDDFDGYGGALWDYTGAILSAPSSTPEEKAAAQRIRDAFIPSKSTLADSYAEEAASAKKNRSKLVERKADLESFPLPNGKTLYDWASAFLDCGDTLDELLNERAMVGVSQSQRKMAARLRSETLGLLFQFRATLRTEITHKKLPADLEGHIFSYLDELSSRRPTKKPKPAETPAPVPVIAPEPEPKG